uniref:Uncharacterized protein n=1 Tax=Timema poppense TaxID=170557 RepID=A0A7R9CIW8_TIMPO|nr:unnamed protein product [Timema poppensis]
MSLVCVLSCLVILVYKVVSHSLYHNEHFLCFVCCLSESVENRSNRFLVVRGRVSVLSVLPGRRIGGSWPPQVLGGLKRVSAALVGSSVCWRVGAWSGSRSHLESGEKCDCLSRVVRSRFPGELTHIGHGSLVAMLGGSPLMTTLTGLSLGSLNLWNSGLRSFSKCLWILKKYLVISSFARLRVMTMTRYSNNKSALSQTTWFGIIVKSDVLSWATAERRATSVGLNCPATFNRAEFYASQLAVVPGKEMESQRKIQWLCDEFDRSRYGQELIKLVTQAKNERRSIIPCRKESDDLDLQSLLEKCYNSNPEGPVLQISVESRPHQINKDRAKVFDWYTKVNRARMEYTHICVESEWKTFRNNNLTAPNWDRTPISVLGSPAYFKSSALDHVVTQRNGPRNRPHSSLMVIHPLKKSSRATPRVLAHIFYTSVDSSMTNWACGNEAKVLFSALLVNVAFPD